MKRGLMLLLACGLAAAAASAEQLASGWIPSSWLPQVQVQLVESENGLDLAILLNTRFMDRVVRTIIEKERGNWPTDDADAAAYIATIKAARERVRADSGREAMKIVFSLKPAPGSVVWYTGEVRENAEAQWEMPAPRELSRVVPSRTYLVRNAALILEDSLGVDRSAVLELLTNRLDAADVACLKEVGYD